MPTTHANPTVAELTERVTALEAERDALRDRLHTAHLMVRTDATDAPGRISTAIRPFLAAAVAEFGLDEPEPDAGTCPCGGPLRSEWGAYEFEDGEVTMASLAVCHGTCRTRYLRDDSRLER